MNYRKFFIGAVIVLLFLSGVIFTGKIWLENQLQTAIQSYGQGNLKVDDVDINSYSGSVDIQDVSLKHNSNQPVEVNNIHVNPRLQSLFSKQIIIDEIRFDFISLDYYLNAPNPIFYSLFSEHQNTDQPTDNSSLKFTVHELILSNAQLRIFESRGDHKPIYAFQPIQLKAGPITTPPKNLHSDVSLTSGINGSDPVLSVNARINGEINSPRIKGTFNIDNGSYPEFINEYIRPIQFRNTVLSLNTTFEYSNNMISLGNLTGRIMNGSINITKTDKTDTEHPNQKGTVPAASLINFGSIQSTQLLVNDFTFNLFDQTSRNPVIDSLTIQTGTTNFESSPLNTKINGIFKKPQAEVALQTSTSLSDENPLTSSVNMHIKTERLAGFNQLLLQSGPFHFKKGNGEAAIQGSVSPQHLDLQIELDLEKTKLETVSNEKKSFLSIPVPVYIRYLSRKDGSVNLGFHLGGTWSDPKLDTSKIRNRILVNLGVDATINTTLGLPITISDKVLEKTTGITIIGDVRSKLKQLITESPKDPTNPLHRKRYKKTRGTDFSRNRSDTTNQKTEQNKKR
ncbi:MAG: hypothetical protein ABEJ65_10360 [bacterium]